MIILFEILKVIKTVLFHWVKVLELLVFTFEYKPKQYLFNGQFSNQYSWNSQSIEEIYRKGIPHAFTSSPNATALLEAGTDIDTFKAFGTF
jgi:hypothetical protein